jgi:CO/xanthine dehydrogenase Mo-binding subunit
MSPFMGGGFGSGLRPQFQVVLAVLAARALQRSVRVVLTRPQMYALGYRPAMIQRIALGANTDGTLDATSHDAVLHHDHNSRTLHDTPPQCAFIIVGLRSVSQPTSANWPKSGAELPTPNFWRGVLITI